MATNVHYQAVIFLFCCVMLSAGLQVEVKSLKYCGPPDKTLKYKVSPWPVITDADSVNFTVTFTPARDIFSLSLFGNVTKDGKTIIERNKEVNCSYVPHHCNFSADETYTLTKTGLHIYNFSPIFKGKFEATLILFNQEQFSVFCVQSVVVVS